MASPKSVEAAIHELAPRYEGMDPFQVETIYQRMARDLYSDGGQIHMNAAAAIEIACWDIIGKATGRPIYDLLGGRYHERLPVYANGWYQGERKPEMFAEKAHDVVATRLQGAEVRSVRRGLAHDDPGRSPPVPRDRRGGARRGWAGCPAHDRGASPLLRRGGDQDRPRAGPIRPDLVRGADRPRQDRRHGAGRAPSCRSRFRPARASPAPTSSRSCWPTIRSTSSSRTRPTSAASSGQGWSAGWSMPSTASSRRTRRRGRSRPPSASRSTPARRTCSSRSCSTSSTSTGSARSSPGTRTLAQDGTIDIPTGPGPRLRSRTSARSRSTRTRPAISCRSSRPAGKSAKANNPLSRRPIRTRSRSDDD